MLARRGCLAAGAAYIRDGERMALEGRLLPAREKLVAHLRDGEIVKGYSRDFAAGRDHFHLVSTAAPVASSRRIAVDELKALFFVRTWGRPPGMTPRRYGFEDRPPRDEPGRRAMVRFRDGERMLGHFIPVDGGAEAFFLLPANPGDNNVKVFATRSSVELIAFLDSPSPLTH
jgi:hypothetical protein